MHESRLAELLDKFPRLNLLVFGDFSLDWYLALNPALTKISVRTGRDALRNTATQPQLIEKAQRFRKAGLMT